MRICEDCKETFENGEIKLDFTSEAWGRLVKHYKIVCPYCGGDDIEEMDKCEICGEWIPPGDEICENCRDLVGDMTDQIRGIARRLTITHKLNYNELIEKIMEEI